MAEMTDLLLQSALSNASLALALAAVALIVERTAKRPVLAHLLWVLVLVKLVTAPAAVEAGEMTNEETEARWEAYKKEIATREKCEDFGLQLRAAVEAGEMTEEEAKWEAYEKQEAAEEK